MARKKAKGHLVLVHWDAAEAEELATPLRAAGWQVKTDRFELKDLKAAPPVAVLISLRRLPSHGREVADALWYTKWGRAIPIVFFDGAEANALTEDHGVKSPSASCLAALAGSILRARILSTAAES